MRYLSLFSGIEAATVAWKPLGWECAAVAEIDPFASVVLAHHYPNTPNLGDVTKADYDSVGPVDLIVFGSPCQSFSIAGKRIGLSDPRGNLALYALSVVDRVRPQWFVFENVPGLLSSGGGRDFGQFLAAVGECGYQCAWRILDAQFFGVPQRRRRVFVVGYLGDWRPPAAVLLERESLFGDITPSREAGQKPARTTSACTRGGVGLGTDYDLDGGLTAHSFRGEGFDASKDGTGRGTPVLPVAIQERAVCENPDAGPDGAGFRTDGMAYTLEARTVPQAVAYDLRGREGGLIIEGHHDAANLRASSGGICRSYISAPMQVRRLTPRECERLQGFPDDYTLVLTRGKYAADGPRYKALGNSMAVPCMRFLGDRINFVRNIMNQKVAA